ncbi:MAG: polyprenol monophosphomannose synthase [Chitinophagaceae bacterium]|nr:polyprenol monophosphomannose synthase [Chitinophagaceae bacterium]
MKNSLIVIPTFNELENISRMIREIFSLYTDTNLLIIDDASPDGTATAVKELQKEFPDRLFIEERDRKQGLGTAYIKGFKWAIERHYEFIFEMDADFSHPPKDLQQLYNACAFEGYDVAIGSRYVKGGQVMNWPTGRVLMSYYASIYVRVITWMPIRDTTAGFVCYRKKVLETIDLDKIKFAGYAFQIEMKFAAWKLGFKIKEVPIVFSDRLEGISKMSKGIFNEAATGVLKMKWKSFFESYSRN